ncbi:MAG: cupredoxin domain-containing protein [Zoogloeaceae bacterium]|nr:cupredoxin domain-containing protein [Zoogloeaceae bacterium]
MSSLPTTDRLWRSVVIAAALLMLAITGAPVQAADMPTIHLLMKDGRLYPETLEVPANTRFRLQIRNEGPGAAEFESLELRKESVLAPGVTRNLVFNPLKPGSYKFFDEFHPETAQGRIISK